ncbi:hypothetical protein [Methanoplanus endosymbiosus]|uniref:Uncharacterized protein n=1 Tax=Methanoplanus endosymbiosus TaxID=33865 RepID=A0A9E7PM44_9EURY|nr:hypothetical protein [Methanoplanus endosymbiosus]UUX91376.1 hypothetical protein L6E24_08280 [Methanoplanus endosymbiosus]
MEEKCEGSKSVTVSSGFTKIVSIAEKSLRYCLIAILLFWSCMLMFVFILNWEGWFFGIRIAGLYAGIYLFTEGLTALLLAVSVIRFPKKRVISGTLSLIFFSFILLDSGVTRQTLHPGSTSIPELFVIFSLIPILYLISCIGKEYSGKKYP